MVAEHGKTTLKTSWLVNDEYKSKAQRTDMWGVIFTEYVNSHRIIKMAEES